VIKVDQDRKTVITSCLVINNIACNGRNIEFSYVKRGCGGLREDVVAQWGFDGSEGMW
jgi:hypothetical protein